MAAAGCSGCAAFRAGSRGSSTTNVEPWFSCVLEESLPTPDAIERFGRLDPSRTAAALHLTC
jgi:hypothetical protein